MILAFGWWMILLLTKNNDAFRAKSQLLRIGLAAEQRIQDEETFFQHPAYLKLEKDYEKQKWMIVGESVVLTISLFLGFWLIHRGYRKEVNAANQQRNFLLSITHELKSPLASIRLVVETILRRALNQEQLNKLGGNALKETDRLNKLVNDLLLSARLESSYELHRTEIDMIQLLEELVEQSKTKYPSSSFILSTKEKELFFYGDFSAISSVFLNLIENSVKYSKEYASITIDCYSNVQGVYVEVKDKGIGIEDKEKKFIFDKFYRIGSEDTRRTKGTGLGLYIVNEIVKAHKGKVLVKDNVPVGTVFKLFFPHANQVL